jgi:P27 family predicted phage terminase small subunit
LNNKKKPTALKLIKGTFHATRDAERRNEPKPLVAIPTPPEGLHEHALKYWQRMSPMLASCGILTVVDESALLLLCNAYADYRDADEKLRRTGLLVKTPRGYPMQNPLVHVTHKAFLRFRACLSDFGMTPSARAGIIAANVEDDTDEEGVRDPLERAIRRSAANLKGRGGRVVDNAS